LENAQNEMADVKHDINLYETKSEYLDLQFKHDELHDIIANLNPTLKPEYIQPTPRTRPDYSKRGQSFGDSTNRVDKRVLQVRGAKMAHTMGAENE